MPKHPKGVKQRAPAPKAPKKFKRGMKVKKGMKGEASQYITRSKAIRKLGLTLKDFRRLCILKGIYPREPNKKLEGGHKTYYHKKDIKYLALDKIVDTFRLLKTFERKFRAAKAQNDDYKTKRLMKQKPKYSLNLILKERYPTFIDAVRDLDDPMCLIGLFASLPSHRLFKIPPKRLETCLKLKREFYAYVIMSRSLRKVFLSIKGIYFQAEIDGQKILWLEPYKFAQQLPYDVDYRVMLSFLEFYEVMLKFVMFKLYSDLKLIYPPNVDYSKTQQADFSFTHLKIAPLDTELAEEENEKYKISEEFLQDENLQQMLKTKVESDKKGVFEGLVFFLSNEVPREQMEFIILSGGGKVRFSPDNFESEEYACEDITHVMTDRVPGTFPQRADRYLFLLI